MKRIALFVILLFAVASVAQVLTAPMPNPHQQFFNANGVPLAGGKLYSYSAGTTTPLATYKDASGQSKNTNPVILDASGSASVWLSSSSYKLVLKDASDVTIWTADNIVVPHGTPLSYRGTWESTIQYTTGDMVTYSGSLYISLVEINQSNQPDTSATQWSVLGYTGVSSDGDSGIIVTKNVAAASINGIYDASKMAGADPGAKINAAYAAVSTYGGVIDLRGFGPGTVNYSTPIVIGASLVGGMPIHPLHVIGDLATTFNFTGTGVPFTVNPYGTNNSKIEGLHITCDAGGSPTDGLLITGSWYLSLDNVWVEGCPYVLHVNNASTVGTYHADFRNVHGTGKTGLFLESVNGYGITHTVITNSTFTGTGTTGEFGDGCRIKATGEGSGVWETVFIGGGCSYANRHSLYVTGPATVKAEGIDLEGSGYTWVGGINTGSTGRGGWCIATDSNVVDIKVDGVSTGCQAGNWQWSAKHWCVTSNGERGCGSASDTNTPASLLERISGPVFSSGVEQLWPATATDMSTGTYYDEYVKTAADTTYRRFCIKPEFNGTPSKCIWFDLALERFGFGFSGGFPTKWLDPSNVRIMQTKRGVAGCTTPGTIGSYCASSITVTWDTAFADTNYAVSCTGNSATNSPGPFVVNSKSTTAITVNYAAFTNAAASYTSIDCTAIHD